MKIFVINLARRRDRRAAMTAQMLRLKMAFEIVTALDATLVSEGWIARHFTATGPLGRLSKGDQCCSLSHRKAWFTFLAHGAPYAAFLEDDVLLDPAAPRLLDDFGWLPPGTDVLKLEHFGPQSQRVLVGERSEIGRGRSIAPILSRHTGAAAYVLSRRAAIELLAAERWDVPVDHLLFNPNVSALASKLKPYQLLPAIARQASGGASDIKPWRLAGNSFGPALIKREIIRAYYELRLLPQQIAQVLSGHAQLVSVANNHTAVVAPASHTLLQQRGAA
ncbi:MAG: glycosyltransferase family 25 protein [Rhizomicrobium sp.]|nr:glycosyltransferase family 25 protein [Rhizomicrobium sp.]